MRRNELKAALIKRLLFLALSIAVVGVAFTLLDNGTLGPNLGTTVWVLALAMFLAAGLTLLDLLFGPM